MSLPRTLLAAALLAPPAAAAELATLDGKKLTGEIVNIAGNELTFKSAAGEDKFLVTTLHSVTIGPAPRGVDSGTRYTTVELIDGSQFRCADVTFKDQTVELKLLPPAGPGAPTKANPRTLTVPMRPALYAINREAGDLKLDQDFRELIRQRSAYDRWVFKRKTTTNEGKEIDRLDAQAGTFGAADAGAETIHFTFARDEGKDAGKETELRISRVSGMILKQSPGAAPPPALCKVIDVDGNELVAQAVARTGQGYAVTTVSGVKVDLTAAQVSKFDFAAGALKFLSDLEPVALEESGTDPEHFQKDKTLDKQPIRMIVDPKAGAKETFPKGLTLKAKTMITFELKGQYKVFRALAGVADDPENFAPSQVKLTIDDAAGVNLWKGSIKKGDKPIDLNLNVTNVDRLRITVESDGTVTDLGNQLSLGNARVLK
jgi:hypothetical protein